MRKLFVLVLLIVAPLGCGVDDGSTPGAKGSDVPGGQGSSPADGPGSDGDDGGPSDGGQTDGGSSDGGQTDGGQTDGGGGVAEGTFVAPEDGVEQGYDLRFEVEGGQISGLVANVLETCDGDVTSRVTTVGPDLVWSIDGTSFSGRQHEALDGIDVYTTLEGEFTSPDTAEGIIRQETLVGGSVCDTYELDFTAIAS